MEFRYLLPYVATNLFAVGVTVATMFWPSVARVILSLTFVLSGIINVYTAAVNPNVYLGYAELTANDYYRSIIEGPFSHHIQLYVTLIAFAQAFIGVFTCYKGVLMRIAMAAGSLFLIAIAPLGLGSAFPATVVLALGYIILLHHNSDLNIYDSFKSNIRGHKQIIN